MSGPDLYKLFEEGRLQPSVPEHNTYIEAQLAALAVTDPVKQAKLSSLYGAKEQPVQEVVVEEVVAEEIAEVPKKKRGRKKKEEKAEEPEEEEIVEDSPTE